MLGEKTEFDWFKSRKPGDTRVSVSFKDKFSGEQLRFIHRIFKLDQHSRIERDLEGRLFINTTRGDTIQLKAVVYEKENTFKEVILQRFTNGKPDPESFSFKDHEFSELLKVLHSIKFIDFNNQHNFKVYDKGEIIITPDSKEKELLDFFSSISGEHRKEIVEALKGQKFTKEDLDILSGRRDALDLFHRKLKIDKDWSELEWQEFFEDNTWIFGYGLSYKFLKILQREAHISSTELNGTNTVKGDYLLGGNKFTVLVELKRPDTPLLKEQSGDSEKGKNRSKSWKLSSDLIEAISQILTQKAEWMIKANTQPNYNNEGTIIDQYTYDLKAILIIGTLDSIQGSDQTGRIKHTTFELFRRDSRNIEIITYDELYERAYYLVNQREA